MFSKNTKMFPLKYADKFFANYHFFGKILKVLLQKKLASGLQKILEGRNTEGSSTLRHKKKIFHVQS